MATLRGFLTNLGKYNEGDLVGEWVDLPIDEDELEDVFKRIGISDEPDENGVYYEEYFWTDWECDIPEVCDTLGEYVSIDEANKLGEMVENVEDPEAFAAAVEILGDTDEAFEHVDEMICIGEGYDVDRIIGEYYSDPSNVGELSQETIERYFDYEALGRDIRLEYYASEEGDPETAGEYWCGDENATDEEIGEAVVSELGFDGISNKEYYFDETSFGRDIHIEGSFCEIDGKIWEYTGR